MEKKLEIIGPYTPEYEGPFCTRDGRPVRLITKTDGSGGYPVVGYIEDALHPAVWRVNGDTYHKGPSRSGDDENDLMNAREVPVAREFWVNEYRTKSGSNLGFPQKTPEDAAEKGEGNGDFIRTIHVREVLPGAADISPTAASVPEMEPEKCQDGSLPVAAWEGHDFHSGYELGFSRDRDRDFLDEQPSSGAVAWHPLVRRSDALREIEELRHALREARTSISSLVNAKPLTTASQGTDGEGHAQ